MEFDPAEQRWKAFPGVLMDLERGCESEVGQVAMDDGTGKMLRACHLQPVQQGAFRVSIM